MHTIKQQGGRLSSVIQGCFHFIEAYFLWGHGCSQRLSVACQISLGDNVWWMWEKIILSTITNGEAVAVYIDLPKNIPLRQKTTTTYTLVE